MGGDFFSGSGGGVTGERFLVPCKEWLPALVRLTAHVPTILSSIRHVKKSNAISGHLLLPSKEHALNGKSFNEKFLSTHLFLIPHDVS
ncbi:hypothetical protein [Candidatus Nitrospira allomarina]|uniref:Uncharacterized protein n=1 Tax=Candidatus Nitrospira allomarina TaxID=3020900 RepID=A0AA96GCT6_9BACT|nr:hypothetical protein [Candidatus Nitrospira allomarina]WNM56658.1 hypothetical protein PP769_11790 [Candidatus Nitrospira allomarina]